MFFKDRGQAGEKLATLLEQYKGQQPLILAVPRGGVAVAKPVWEALGGELDLIITRKLGAPGQPELAIGAVSGDGFVMLNKDLTSQLNVTEDYIQEVAEQEKQEINRRLKLYRGSRPQPKINNRLVILIDDGIATGYTILAALRSLREKSPSRLVLAVPVGPPETFGKLEKEVDDLVYIKAPENFAAVGQFYRKFNQISDREVAEIMGKPWQGDD
ncbi:MAG: phosphoribosyltransferase [Bacillota bacterium]